MAKYPPKLPSQRQIKLAIDFFAPSAHDLLHPREQPSDGSADDDAAKNHDDGISPDF